ncbi:MAG: glycosyltransferase family 2 protein [Schleiferiaceae bacterium]
MKRVTLLIPAQNAADLLPRCIESCAGLYDELLLVDSGSTDGSLEVAARYGARILQRDYENSASQKNWAIPQARHEWILLLDSDEWLSPELHREIGAWRSQPEGPEDGFWLYRANWFMGRRVRYSGWQGDKVVRVFRRDACRYESKQVHAEITAAGPIGRFRYRLNHNTFVDLPTWEAKLRRYAEWQAGDYDARTPVVTPYHTLLKPAWRFLKHFVLRGGILDGYVGYRVSAYAAWAVWLRYDVLRRRRATSRA